MGVHGPFKPTCRSVISPSAQDTSAALAVLAAFTTLTLVVPVPIRAATGRTMVSQGVVHLVIFAAFLFLAIAP
jgi:Ca2+/H+ antiporter